MNIYYGSQSGNCEEISKILYHTFQEHTIRCDKCDPLNAFDITSLVDKDTTYIFIICSTYGNGDPPENAAKFWRQIKKRTIDPVVFQNVSFSILALGNSNYDKFCNFGKNLNKRFEELGGTRIFDIVCVDEVCGLEDPVRKWCDQVIDFCLEKKREGERDRMRG